MKQKTVNNSGSFNTLSSDVNHDHLLCTLFHAFCNGLLILMTKKSSNHVNTTLITGQIQDLKYFNSQNIINVLTWTMLLSILSQKFVNITFSSGQNDQLSIVSSFLLSTWHRYFNTRDPYSNFAKKFHIFSE